MMKRFLQLAGLGMAFLFCSGMGGNSGPGSGGVGTVTAVTGGNGLTSTGGATPVIALPACTAAQLVLENAGATAFACATLSGAGDLGTTSIGATGVLNAQVTGGTHLTSVGSATTGTTQSAGDNSTKLATTGYVDTAVTASNPAIAVNVATTAAGDTSGLTYANGVAGIGATLTGSVNTAVTIDGVTFTTLGQALLVKNDTVAPSGSHNGLYTFTQIQTGILPPIFTRRLDYDQPSDINNTGTIPVISGTANTNTSWLLTSSVATIGTDALTYTQFTFAPSKVLNTSTAPDAGTRTATANRYPKGDGTNWNTSSGSASGTGACAASNWASTLNSDAAPTCTQPNFTDLAGTGTSAQTPEFTNFEFVSIGGANTAAIMGPIYLVDKTVTIQSGTAVFLTLTACAAGGATIKLFDCGTTLPANGAACSGGTALVTWASGTATNAGIAGTINSATLTATHYVAVLATTLNSCTAIAGSFGVVAH